MSLPSWGECGYQLRVNSRRPGLDSATTRNQPERCPSADRPSCSNLLSLSRRSAERRIEGRVVLAVENKSTTASASRRRLLQHNRERKGVSQVDLCLWLAGKSALTAGSLT